MGTNKGIIKSVQKSLKILKYIIAEEREVTITELVEEFGYNQSTVHHLLKTLNLEGFVSQNLKNKKYNIGPELFNTWLIYRKGVEYFQRGEDIIQEVVDKTKETTNLFIKQDGRMTCILGKESPKTLKAYLIVGREIPLHATAAGRVYLAFMEEEKREETLEKINFKKYLKNTITDWQEFRKELEEIREKGYAVECEEYEELINAVALPVFGKENEIIASMSIVGPKNRWTLSRIKELTPYLFQKSKEFAKKINNTGY